MTYKQGIVALLIVVWLLVIAFAIHLFHHAVIISPMLRACAELR